MSNIKKLTGIDGLSHFSASGSHVKPHEIGPNREIVEILTGGSVFFENCEYHKGAIFWHIAGDYTIAKTTDEDPYRCMVFNFVMSENTTRTIPKVSIWSNVVEMELFFKKAVKCFHSGLENRQALAQYLYSSLYWEVVSSQEPVDANMHLPLPLQRSLKFIKRHVHENYSMDRIASYVGVSKPHLFLLFKQHLKTSPHKYINNYRINHALTLLAGTSKTIKQIADECGFDSMASFYRVFKQHHNISPAVYRENNNPYQMV